MSKDVTVSKGVLIGLAASAVCGLVAVAFLLGRLSGRSEAPAPPQSAASTPQIESQPSVQQAAAPSEVPARPYELQPEGRTSAAPQGYESRPAGSPVELGPMLDAVPTPAPSPASRGDAPSETTRAEVARYLDAVDNIGAGKIGEGEGVANEMAAALVRGDTSGLDRMIRDTEGARTKLRALVPPPVCATHHRESLGSVDDALEMLGALKTAMQSPDPAVQLASVAGRATDLRTRAEAVQREEQSLRQRFGLTR